MLAAQGARDACDVPAIGVVLCLIMSKEGKLYRKKCFRFK